MIEIPTISDYRGYSFDDVKSHKGGNAETESEKFVTLMGSEFDSVDNKISIQGSNGDNSIIVSGKEIAMYTDYGALLFLGNYRGRNIDIEV
jgi:hypothetical protein